jgi:hypothetical protein
MPLSGGPSPFGWTRVRPPRLVQLCAAVALGQEVPVMSVRRWLAEDAVRPW